LKTKTEPATLTALTTAGLLGEKYLKQIHFDIDQNTGTTAGDGAPTTPPKDDINLNPDAIFRKGYSDGLEKGKKRLLEEFSKKGLDLSSEEEIEKLLQLRKSQEDLDTEKLMKKEQFDTLLSKTQARFEAQLKQKDEMLGKFQTQLHRVAVENAIVAQASKLNAVKPDIVARLIQDEYKFDIDFETLSVSLSGKDGKPAISKKTGNELSISEAVEIYLSENTYLVKADNLNGSGAKGTNLPAGSGKSTQGMSFEEKKKAAIELMKTQIEKQG